MIFDCEMGYKIGKSSKVEGNEDKTERAMRMYISLNMKKGPIYEHDNFTWWPVASLDMVMSHFCFQLSSECRWIVVKELRTWL